MFSVVCECRLDPRKGTQMRFPIAVLAAALLATLAFAPAAPAEVAIGHGCGPAPRIFNPPPIVFEDCTTAECLEAGAITDPATGNTLNGRISPWNGDARWWFEYGSSASNYTAKTPEDVAPAGGQQKVSATVAGLSPGTHFRLAVRSCGNTKFGADQTAGGAAADAPAADPTALPDAGGVAAPELAIAGTSGDTPADPPAAGDQPAAAATAVTVTAANRVKAIKKVTKAKKAAKHKKHKKATRHH